MGFLIGLAVFAVIIWVIIIIAINKDLDSYPTPPIRSDNVALPSVPSNSSSNQTSSEKNFYNSEAAKYCCKKIINGMLEEIAYANVHHAVETITVSYDFRVTRGHVELCNEYRYYTSAAWEYIFYDHHYPPLSEHADRRDLAMAICKRVNTELKTKLPAEAKLTYSTEYDDYKNNPSFTVFIKYTAPNPNYIEMKSW